MKKAAIGFIAALLLIVGGFVMYGSINDTVHAANDGERG
jgi:hypothetical protein